MNWNEEMTVKTHEYLGALQEVIDLKKKVAERDERISTLEEFIRNMAVRQQNDQIKVTPK